MEIDQIQSSKDLQSTFKNYLNDESGLVSDGFAELIYFPTSSSQVSSILKAAYKENIPVTVSGGGTGISGGRVPLGGWIIATDSLRQLDDEFKNTNQTKNWKDPQSGLEYEYQLIETRDEEAYIKLPASITLTSLQLLVRELGWFYPPDPTERSCYLGGNVATNASGARSFKFGATRPWVQQARVVLPQGEILTFDRNEPNTLQNAMLIVKDTDIQIPLPNLNQPRSTKNVAGPVIYHNSDALDVFIGTGGIFGVVTNVMLRLIRPPKSQVSIFAYLPNLDSAIELIKICQLVRKEQIMPVPLSVEYLGPRCVGILQQVEKIPEECKAIIMLELDATSEDELYEQLGYWMEVFEKTSVIDTSVATSHTEIEHHKHLRHKIPETVNGMVRSFGQPKLGTDYAVPEDTVDEIFWKSFQVGNEFEAYQSKRQPFEEGEFGYAIWAHAGDAHLHLNLMPRDVEETAFAKQKMIELMEWVTKNQGSIAAEHGLGKKRFNDRPAIIIQYGEQVIEKIKNMKAVLDPKFLLNRGNLIGFDEQWI